MSSHFIRYSSFGISYLYSFTSAICFTENIFFVLSVEFILERTQNHCINLWIFLNSEQIRDYSIALFMYKLTKHLLHPLFENMLIKTSDVHYYSTRQTGLLYVQYAATKITKRTETLWNKIMEFFISYSTPWLYNKQFQMQLEILCLVFLYIVCDITIKMNLGHLSITSAPIVKVEIPLLLFILFTL